jgi:regulator of sigma E protease
MGSTGTIIAAILIFGAIIFFHELGHFATAKWSGITVHEFAVGMGPALFKKEYHHTMYSLRILPIGGYTLMEGEDADVDSEGSFSRKPIWKRIVVLLAGSMANILMGYLILAILTVMSGYVGTTRIAEFWPNAQSEGQLAVGDRILRVNGHRVATSNDITYEFLRDRDGLIDLVIERNQEKIPLTVQFPMEEVEGGLNMISIDLKSPPSGPGRWII